MMVDIREESIITTCECEDERNIKLQAHILTIAKEVKRICEKHNINYYLSGGSLLGAIRHKGFIPWDDDFDIGIPRAEFDRFITVCGDEIDENIFFLQTENSEEKYCFAFAKLQLRNTLFLEDFSKEVPIQHGIFVDIFPLDNYPDGKLQRIVYLAGNYVLKNLIWIKCGYGENKHKKKILFKLLKYSTHYMSLAKLKRIRHNLVSKYSNIETECYIYCDYPKGKLKREWFKERQLYDFEDTMFWGVADYDALLRYAFNEYMLLPPKEKRKQHSTYEVIYNNIDT